MATLLWTLAACGGPAETPVECPTVESGPTALYAPDAVHDDEAAHWLRRPFPSDARRTADGHPDLADFPNPDRIDVLDTYAETATEQLDGFGTNPMIYVRFDHAVDAASIPTDPASFTNGNAVLQLVDVTPGSAEYGRRRPLLWKLVTVDGKFVPRNTLVVAPQWGFPLRRGTTYAFYVTRPLSDADATPFVPSPLLAALAHGADATCAAQIVDAGDYDLERDVMKPALDLWRDEDRDPNDLVALTVFTTQTITTDLAAIHAQIADGTVKAEVQSSGWVEVGGAGVYALAQNMAWAPGKVVNYHLMEGRARSPIYLEGDPPYVEGGGFHFVDGAPTPDHYEDLRFVLTVPDDPPPDGGNCYPVIECAHGTTGNVYTCNDDGTAGRNAARGLATIGFEQPLHGARWSGSSSDTSVEFYTFNILNPDAARTLLRQSAVDTFALTHLLLRGLVVPAVVSPTGADLCLDPARVAFFGHSQGGVSGSIAAGIETHIDAWVLSGAGGGLTVTAFDAGGANSNRALVEALVLPNPGEEVDSMHPIATLAQLLGDVTDPINLAPYWHHLGKPRSFLMTSGATDPYTPAATADAMALAGYLPEVKPVPIPIPAYDTLGLDSVSAPVSANADGQTVGFLQWADDGQASGHFVIYDRPEAINAAARFLQSWAYEGGPVIERDPGAQVY